MLASWKPSLPLKWEGPGVVRRMMRKEIRERKEGRRTNKRRTNKRTFTQRPRQSRALTFVLFLAWHPPLLRCITNAAHPCLRRGKGLSDYGLGFRNRSPRKQAAERPMCNQFVSLHINTRYTIIHPEREREYKRERESVDHHEYYYE